jgi:tetratricopeptide (TPR) repeat protein
MKKHRNIAILFNKLAFSAILFGFTLLLKAQNDSTSTFAHYLLRSGQYSFAAEEFERLIFDYPQSDNYKLSLLKAYRFSEQFEQGINSYQRFGTSNNKDLSIEYTRLLINSKGYINYKSYIETSSLFNAIEKNDAQIAYHFLIHDDNILRDSKLDALNISPAYANILKEYRRSNFKSPFLAGALSAIVPGTGKMYSGRVKDGVVSLIFVGLTGYQAYRGFSKKGTDSVYPWIVSSISFSFYLGNIYGSVKAGKNYNKSIQQNYANRITNLILNH